MAHAPGEEVAFDAEARVERRRHPLMALRGLADWSVAALFFAIVSFAAIDRQQARTDKARAEKQLAAGVNRPRDGRKSLRHS